METPVNPTGDSTIADLHRIRERIVESFHGDLQALTADAQRRQLASGRRVVRRGELAKKASRKIATPPADEDRFER